MNVYFSSMTLNYVICWLNVGLCCQSWEDTLDRVALGINKIFSTSAIPKTEADGLGVGDLVQFFDITSPLANSWKILEEPKGIQTDVVQMMIYTHQYDIVTVLQ